MTLVIALDTSTEEMAIGIGWLREGGVHLAGETNLEVPRASLTHLVPTLSRLLESTGIGLRDVDAIVCGRGPGSFTGVRIGVAAAKGMAQGLQVPLYGVGTLDAVAHRFAGRDGLLGVVGDAMRREVYPALFRCQGGRVERLTADAVSAPGLVAQQWAALGEPLLLAGNGLRKYADIFRDAIGEGLTLAPEGLWAPSGESLLAVAWRAWDARELGGGDAGALLPVYTRLSDAEEMERVRCGLGPVLPVSGVAGPEGGSL